MGKVRQPQRIPPPIMHGDGAIDAEIVLQENEGALALSFWKTVRTVRLWAELPANERAHAFEKTASEERRVLLADVTIDQLAEPLERAAGVLQPRARSTTVARACREIAEWCVDNQRTRTAIEFMQAAAVSLPEDADLAHQVARLCRTATEYHRAETWYREGISRARRNQTWNDFARSYIGLGTVYCLRGNYPQANRALLRGLRAARRFSIRPLVAAAAHELVVVAIHTHRPQDVVRYGKLALESYGEGHARLPALGHDIGLFMLNEGYFAAARRLLTATPESYGGTVEQLARWSAIVRLAGALGDRAMYDDALARAEPLLQQSAATTVGVQACLAVARGALSIGEIDRAREAAAQARRLADERGEAKAQFAVEGVEESIRNEAEAKERGATPEKEKSIPPALAGFVGQFEEVIRAGSGE